MANDNVQHGFAYQLKLLLLFLHRAYINTDENESSKYDEFKFYTELEDAEKFDDVVLQYRQNGEIWNLRLFQLKHTEKEGKTISIKDLQSENGDFSIQKYFRSFLRIRERCRDSSQNSEFRNSMIQDLNIVTNITIEEDTIRKIFEVDAVDSDFFIFGPLPTNQSEIKIFKFKNSDSEMVSKFKNILHKCCDFKTLINKLVTRIKNDELELKSDEIVNYYNYPLVHHVFDLSEDEKKLTFKEKFILNEEYVNFRSNLFSELEKNLKNTNIKTIQIKAWKKICDCFKIVKEANKENLIQLSELISECVHATKKSVTDINSTTFTVSNGEHEKTLSNLIMLSDYVLIKKEDKIQFRLQFFHTEELPENVFIFREQLKKNLGNWYNEMHNFEFVIKGVKEFFNGKNFNRNLPLDIIDSDITEFIEKFKIINYPDRYGVENLINMEIRGRWTTNSDLIISRYTKKMYDWMVDRKTVFHTKETTLKMFTECEIMLENIILSKSIFPLSEFKYKEDPHLNEYLTQNQICHFEVGNMIFWRSKLLQKFNQNNSGFVYIQDSIKKDKNFVQKAIECFGDSKFYDILIMEFEKNVTNLKSLFSMVEEILENNQNKKFLILTLKKTNNLEEFLQTKCISKFEELHSNSLNSFIDQSQEKILNSYLLFQGNDIKACDLFNNAETKILVDEQMITKLIDRKSIIIGQKIRSPIEYDSNFYIERKFKCLESGNVFSENDLLEVTTKKLTLISNVAGMGKTSVVTSLIKTFKDDDPSKWCFRIDLNDYGRQFQQMQKLSSVNIDDLIHNIFDKSLENFSQQILKHKLIKTLGNPAIPIFLDGFDEISPNFDEVVTTVIEELMKNNCKIFITTRPQSRQLLEKRFEGDINTYELEPLTETDQKNYLKEHWKIEWRIKEVEAIDYYENIFNSLDTKIFRKNYFVGEMNFFSIPLHLEMLRTIFDTKETADNFLKSDIKSFTILTLYKKFIDRKYEIYRIEKCVEKTGVALQHEDDNPLIFESFMENHKIAAITTILTKYKLEHVTDIEQIYVKLKTFLDNVKAGRERHGLIKDVVSNSYDEHYRPVFIHKTFAEFFAARFIIDLMINPNTTEDQLSYIFKSLLLFKFGDNSPFQLFIDMQLTEELRRNHIYNRMGDSRYENVIKSVIDGVLKAKDNKSNHFEYNFIDLFQSHLSNTYKLVMEMIKDNIELLDLLLQTGIKYGDVDSTGKLLGNANIGESSFFKGFKLFSYVEPSCSGTDIIKFVLQYGIENQYLQFSQNDEFMKALLNRDFEKAQTLQHSDINFVDKIMLFFYFVATNDKNSVGCMINCGFDVNTKYNEKHTALYFALKMQLHGMIKFFVCDREIKLKNDDYYNAILCTINNINNSNDKFLFDEDVYMDTMELIKTLCRNYNRDHKIDCNQTEDNEIKLVSYENNLETIKFILDYVWDTSHDLYNKTLLHVFDTKRKFEYKCLNFNVLKLFIDKLESKDLEHKNTDGLTLLHHCVRNILWPLDEQMKFIQHLINMGADSSTNDNKGNTLLHSAVLVVGQKHLSCFLYEWIKFIVSDCQSNGSFINERNKDDKTPLDIVLFYYSKHRQRNLWELKPIEETMQFLIDNGANPNSKNSRGISAFDYVKSINENYILLNILRKYNPLATM